MMNQPIGAALVAKRRSADAVLGCIESQADVIVGLGNGEPVTVLDAIEREAHSLDGVRLHQMLPLRDRPYINGEVPGLTHVSWFLSPHNKDAFHRGECELVPNNFSEVPHLMRRTLRAPLVVAAVSPPDAHGFFSLGSHAEYVASFIGELPFFVEVSSHMPRTYGENQLHISQVSGWCESEHALVELPDRAQREADRRIAELVAERIPNEATVQAGIGTIPDLVLGLLHGHKDLGVHTELLGDGFVDLVGCGAVTGTKKKTHRNKLITTTALGSRRLYDFVADNPGVEFWPVDHTNDSQKIAREPRMTAINATLEVDFLGQCASESLGSDYWSSSGGQADFARGAVLAEEGQSFIVLHSATADGSTSRIVPQLHPGAAVTTFKNVVDKVVTEQGVAELRGKSIRERTRRLIDVAHPRFREELEGRAHELGYL